MYFNEETKELKGINGSGRAPAGMTIERLRESGITDCQKLEASALSVTVPGTAAAWCDTVESFGSGSLTLSDILQPAIQYCDSGVVIQPKTAKWWLLDSYQLSRSPNGGELLIDGKPPKAGSIFRNHNLGKSLRLLAEHGKDGFYKGHVADAIVKVLADLGGVMTNKDLESHTSTFESPISVNYRGYDVYEMPPNGQGLTALLALNILEGYELNKMDPFSAEYIHLVIESMRLAFSDTRYYVTDPTFHNVPIKELLSKEYAEQRRMLIDQSSANKSIAKGYPVNSSNTVYLSVADRHGNACSFINSNYTGFGSGIIPKGCGFTLQNRGANFSLEEGHPNSLVPGKRPYHTIIPGMILKDGHLFASFGVMGAWIQAQAHVQVVTNLIDHLMNPQEALSHPRYMIEGGVHHGELVFEQGHRKETVEQLKSMGHNITSTDTITGDGRKIFGNGQVIIRSPVGSSDIVLCAGSDNRCDGAALSY
eukprot:gene9171-10762_t